MNEDPWKGLTQGNMRRVNAEGRFDFFWATVEKGAPALVMRVREGVEHKADLPKLKNLDIRFRTVGGPALVLSLLDPSQREIFETLCRDIVSAGEDAPDDESALQRVVRRTRRWFFLLKGGSATGLSLEEQRGLVGELACLRELAEVASPETAVEGWMGPLGSAKDFEFPDVCIEVKARRGAAKPYVRISSEDQLTDIAERSLFLRVYDVDSAVLPEGLSLHDHVNLTYALLEQNPDCLDWFENCLEAVGYDRSHDYEKRRWIVGRTRTFEVSDGFPRITSPLTTGVQNITYSIDLAECVKFETTTDPATLVAGN